MPRSYQKRARWAWRAHGPPLAAHPLGVLALGHLLGFGPIGLSSMAHFHFSKYFCLTDEKPRFRPKVTSLMPSWFIYPNGDPIQWSLANTIMFLKNRITMRMSQIQNLFFRERPKIDFEHFSLKNEWKIFSKFLKLGKELKYFFEFFLMHEKSQKKKSNHRV